MCAAPFPLNTTATAPLTGLYIFRASYSAVISPPLITICEVLIGAGLLAVPYPFTYAAFATAPPVILTILEVTVVLVPPHWMYCATALPPKFKKLFLTFLRLFPPCT